MVYLAISNVAGNTYPLLSTVSPMLIQTFEKQITQSNQHYFLNPADKEKTTLKTNWDPPKRTWNRTFH